MNEQNELKETIIELNQTLLVTIRQIALANKSVIPLGMIVIDKDINNDIIINLSDYGHNLVSYSDKIINNNEEFEGSLLSELNGLLAFLIRINKLKIAYKFSFLRLINLTAKAVSILSDKESVDSCV